MSRPIWSFLSGTVQVSFRHATRLLRALRSEGEETGKLNEAVGTLFLLVAQADALPNEEELAFITELFAATFGRREGKRVQDALGRLDGLDLDRACGVLRGLSASEVVELVRGMLEVGFSDGGVSEAELGVILRTAGHLKMEKSTVLQHLSEIQDERERRNTVVRSGAGILAAVMVIVIFVFTATFLRSVLFGLMLAYFFLPLQQWYQNRFFPHPWVVSAYRLLNLPVLEDARVARASQATLFSAGLLGTGLLAGLGLLSWQVAGQGAAEVGWLEQFGPELGGVPMLGEARAYVLATMTDPVKQEELLKLALEHVQSILLRAGSVVMGLMHLLLDAMLTVFFFSFFLQRIASEQRDELGRLKSAGETIVEAIFESGWLPDMQGSTIKDAQVIIDDTLGMLRVWVRGYLWIILIESILYTGIFMFLGVPWFALAGVVAGSTILVPVVGPIVGCSLTLLATLAMNPHAITPMVGVVTAYMLIHGVLEQLFLYPSLVGKALGLNTLETIIVVLLGGILAGLAGVIFAVPAAAILKRLIPRIYTVLRRPTSTISTSG